MILPYTKTNKAGVKEQYWTHSSFIDGEEYFKIEQDLQTRNTYRNYLGLFSAIAGLAVYHVVICRSGPMPSSAKLSHPKYHSLELLPFSEAWVSFSATCSLPMDSWIGVLRICSITTPCPCGKIKDMW